MEKFKYIVSRLALILGGAGGLLLSVYALGTIAASFGIAPVFVAYGLMAVIVIGMLIFWLAESYEIKQMGNK